MPRGDNPNSKKNLKKGNAPTQFKKGVKRSKSSIEKQKETILRNKTMREILEAELDKVVGDKDNKMTAKNAIMLKIIQNAIETGDINTIKFIRETIGEQPSPNMGNIDKLDTVLDEIEGNI